jgi:hypothetical protein|tara:strand:+ start:207 stop:530 length:324 start_codon:yes stop_codon:yes gene_type:complete
MPKKLKNGAKAPTKNLGQLIKDEVESNYNQEARASYPQVMKLAMHFSKLPKCPKDIKFGTLRGHYLASLNDVKKPLTQGSVTKLLELKAVPASVLKSMRAYKDLQSL